MIHWIKQWFCKHDLAHVRAVEYTDCTVDSFICKKCGWKRRVIT